MWNISIYKPSLHFPLLVGWSFTTKLSTLVEETFHDRKGLKIYTGVLHRKPLGQTSGSTPSTVPSLPVPSSPRPVPTSVDQVVSTHL